MADQQLDQTMIDTRFREIAQQLDATFDATTPLPRHHTATKRLRRTPTRVADLFTDTYLDITAAGSEHGFDGVHVGISDAAWDTMTHGGTTRVRDLETRFAMLMASARIAVVDAMVGGGTATTFTYLDNETGSMRVDLTIRYASLPPEPGNDEPLQVVLLDLAAPTPR